MAWNEGERSEKKKKRSRYTNEGMKLTQLTSNWNNSDKRTQTAVVVFETNIMHSVACVFI